MKPFHDAHTAQGLREAACNLCVDLASFAEDRPDRLKSPLQNGPEKQTKRQSSKCRSEYTTNKFDEPGTYQIPYSFNIRHDSRYKRTCLVRIVLPHRQSPDV